jgi:hypothetical protein
MEKLFNIAGPAIHAVTTSSPPPHTSRISYAEQIELIQ